MVDPEIENYYQDYITKNPEWAAKLLADMTEVLLWYSVWHENKISKDKGYKARKLMGDYGMNMHFKPMGKAFKNAQHAPYIGSFHEENNG